ncbi:Por secretion system C-terminal sorting domain-containing protein [Cyclonatronum proteinivorum]|uniref:Por secretion system C-terminal sorting domain-containing protein n=1 Tax=Cyclonatronum proteinivorum TaxID=1457365 RepID=A0A345UH84_9BACT|nr:BspA family leucine-rich repeat surface protein [Cyclonatronum proteinivorum]AXI99835.1 Por secretion system C-terminal sorting domain-containing protein [Cyclonatronum proteinivorum]
MKIQKGIILLLAILFVRLVFTAPDVKADPPALFYLAPNDVTVLCPDANVDDKGTVTINDVGIEFTKLDRNGILALLGDDENNPLLSTTCTSGITDMSELFLNRSTFNQPIGSWDVSSVTNMTEMFRAATAFNQPIGDWDTSNVTSMQTMFGSAGSFNQAIGGWDTSSVTTMFYMFWVASNFDQPIGDWDTSSVTNMDGMFVSAASFNQNLSGWCVSLITSTPSFFDFGASAWVLPNSRPVWGTCPTFLLASNGVTITCVAANIGDKGFVGADEYTKLDRDGLDALLTANPNNPEFATTCTSGILDMSSLFQNRQTFNQPIGSWDVSSVTNMSNMFSEARAFNQDIGSWNVSSVTRMDGMFMVAFAFDRDIGSWNVSSVTDMVNMFNAAIAFNQDIGSWNVSSVTDMSNMFRDARVFNHDIGSWDVSSVTNMQFMFLRAMLFNQDIGSWDVSSVTGMQAMFNTTPFNQNIGSWDVSNVTQMVGMFRDNSAFNQDIGNWDVSSVTDMSNMFTNATAFNRDLRCWEVMQITNEPTGFGTFANKPIWGTRGHCLWTGSTDGDLNTGSNWAGNTVPPTNLPMIFENNSLVLATGTDFQNEVRVRSSGSLVIGSGVPVLFSGGITGGEEVTFQRDINSHSRWVGFSTPVSGAAFAGNDGLFNALWTQGFPGSDDPNASASSANVIFYDEASATFTAPGSNTIEAGKGYFIYVFERKDRDDENTALEFPLTTQLTGPENSFGAENRFTFSVSQESTDGWNLLGNPFAASLDWANGDWTKTGIDNFAYLWNPATGNYQVTTGGSDSPDNVEGITASNHIAPFQAFFVKANSAGPELSVPATARSVNAANAGLFSESPAPVFTLKLEAGGHESFTGFRFGEEYSQEFGHNDAYFLSPMATSFAYTYSVKGNNATMLNSLPLDMDEAVSFPIAAGAFADYQFYEGEATFSWPTFSNIPSGMVITLTDTHTGAVIDLREEQSYSFQMSAAGLMQKGAEVKNFRDLQADGSPVMSPMFAGERFVLTIDPEITTDIPTDGQLPAEFALHQNYPNPFNPATQIRYELPESAEVRLDVFNIQGQRVATLVNGQQNPGIHTVRFNGSALSSGVYLYRLQAGTKVLTQKMTLIK